MLFFYIIIPKQTMPTLPDSSAAERPLVCWSGTEGQLTGRLTSNQHL